jgi:hypothetical protein
MGADLSRLRFDSLSDHAGVVLQQGRLLLDADWNELVSILDRRQRASTADLHSNGPAPGKAGVAVVPRTTPDAFKVTLSGGALTIGRGRMYVDGILAENHGVGDLAFDPLLAEQQHTDDTPYADQPYGPVPDLPTSGTHLAYLDVWEREVTSVEDPDLVDPAIGVDTTAVTQTAWQVRLHEVDGTTTCTTPDDDIDDWPGVIVPTPSRLSVVTDPDTIDSDPCALPPSGGYRGLENQTYRVEIHDGGPAGTATFKWSRDNGSVVSPVLEAAADGLSVRPAHLGRDAVLGFDTGDWVEVIDDHRELQRLPGAMRKVDGVVDGKLVFTDPLSGDLRLNTTDAAERHLRVRRWDQNGEVKNSSGTVVGDLNDATASGVIEVPSNAATRIVLENGVTVKFTANGGKFRVGDHWIFAARTADASVEELDEAPPAGPHHHFARLGILSFPDSETDCRTLWPPECDCDGEGGGCSDCTVCVTPESHASGEMTIQMAIDLAKEAWGTVCLAGGIYQLPDDGVSLDGARSVTLRGQGPASVLICQGNGISVRGAIAVTVEDLSVVNNGSRPCVEVGTGLGVTLQRLALLQMTEVDQPRPAVGMSGFQLRPRLVDNVVFAPVGISSDAERSLFTTELAIRGNLLFCAEIGISLSGRVAHQAGNVVADNGLGPANEVGIRLLGTLAPGSTFEVSGNYLSVGGSGIEVGNSGYAVVGNEIVGSEESIERRGDGILVVPGSLADLPGPTRIDGNRVAAIGGVGVAVLMPVTTLDVAHNQVERAVHGIVMGGKSQAERVDVSHNKVRDVGSRETDKADGATGIQVVGAGSATIGCNTVHGVGTARESGPGAAGIRVLACPEVRVVGNSVDRVGFPEVPRGDAGIAVIGLVGRVQVSGNTVRRQPVADESRGDWVGVLIGFQRTETGAMRAGDYTIVDAQGADEQPDEVLVMARHAAYVATRQIATVTVDGNLADGDVSNLAAVQVAVAGHVVASSNQCRKRLDDETAAGLSVEARSASINANHCLGGLPTAITLTVPPERLAALGNVVSSEVILVMGNPLDDPWQPLNVYNVG